MFSLWGWIKRETDPHAKRYAQIFKAPWNQAKRWTTVVAAVTFHALDQFRKWHRVKVRSKEVVEGLFRLAYTHFGLGFLHSCWVVLEVIIPLRERAESESKKKNLRDLSWKVLRDLEKLQKNYQVTLLIILNESWFPKYRGVIELCNTLENQKSASYQPKGLLIRNSACLKNTRTP
jgi:hypothetical protein